MYFETECEMAVQGHPRVIDFGIPIESVQCNFVSAINSNIGPILPRFRYIAGFLPKTAPHPYSTRILGVFE